MVKLKQTVKVTEAKRNALLELRRYGDLPKLSQVMKEKHGAKYTSASLGRWLAGKLQIIHEELAYLELLRIINSRLPNAKEVQLQENILKGKALAI